MPCLRSMPGSKVEFGRHYYASENHCVVAVKHALIHTQLAHTLILVLMVVGLVAICDGVEKESARSM